MPNFTTDSPIDLALIKRVERCLPVLDLNNKIDFNSVNGPLAAYFEAYGFDQMQAAHNCNYALGFLHLCTYRVAAHVWLPASPKATVFVSHGLFDHVGLFLDLIDELVSNGFAVLAIDFPGHGLSEGEPAVIRNFREYAEVIAQTLGELESRMPGPMYALGQSTGAAALLNYVLNQSDYSFKKLILLAPLIQPRGWKTVNTFYILLHKFRRFVKRSFTVNSHRAGFNDFLEGRDPLQPRSISVEWVGAMREWVKSFPDFSDCSLPTLVLQGSEDKTVNWPYNIPAIKSKFPHAEIEMLLGAMHHLANESDQWREPMFKKIVDFLGAE